MERSLRSGLESHNFLTWSVVALIRSLHEKKLLPMDDPVISQLQKSFSKACGNVASCITSNAAFVTLKRRQLLLSHVVPSVSDAQKRNLLSDPFFRQVLFSLLGLWKLLDLPLVTCPCLSHILRPHRRRLNLVVHHTLALQPREALLDNLLDNLLHSDLLPLSDSSLARRVIRASRRSLPEPPRNGGVFGSRSLDPLWQSAAAWPTSGWLGGLGGVDAWVVEALRVGYRIPFDRRPPLSERPLSLPAYSPQSIKGVALTQELQTLLRKGAVEPAPQSPGFYSRLFLVQKASGSWRPIIDLSTLNDYITSSPFTWRLLSQSFVPSARVTGWSPWTCRMPTCRFQFITIRVVIFASW